ncbi:MAG: quinone oxidoreductase [Rhodospirillales bacterium]|nr:quinone oxidoreductase [Rhodospirillales bacterium]
MTKAIIIHSTGGPEVMKWETVDVGRPAKGQVRIRQTAVGLNYIDVYYRSGFYPITKFPSSIGLEAAGVIEEIGPGVKGLKVGMRVAYCSRPNGAYAETRLYDAASVVPLPKSITDKTAAAMMLKGLTAEYLLRRTYKVGKGDTILVHAAAGGVGLILCQWGKHLGATVIGTVGSDAKAKVAKANGCHHPIVYTRENFRERVREITGGEGCDVVYDSVGKTTFAESLGCLRRRGMMVTFGNASGPVLPISPLLLSQHGSLFLTRPSLGDYVATRRELLTAAEALFDVVKKKKVKIHVNQTYPLRDAAQAHADLAARKTTGSTVLIP